MHEIDLHELMSENPLEIGYLIVGKGRTSLLVAEIRTRDRRRAHQLDSR